MANKTSENEDSGNTTTNASQKKKPRTTAVVTVVKVLSTVLVFMLTTTGYQDCGKQTKEVCYCENHEVNDDDRNYLNCRTICPPWGKTTENKYYYACSYVANVTSADQVQYVETTELPYDQMGPHYFYQYMSTDSTLYACNNAGYPYAASGYDYCSLTVYGRCSCIYWLAYSGNIMLIDVIFCLILLALNKCQGYDPQKAVYEKLVSMDLAWLFLPWNCWVSCYDLIFIVIGITLQYLAAMTGTSCDQWAECKNNNVGRITASPTPIFAAFVALIIIKEITKINLYFATKYFREGKSYCEVFLALIRLDHTFMFLILMITQGIWFFICCFTVVPWCLFCALAPKEYDKDENDDTPRKNPMITAANVPPVHAQLVLSEPAKSSIHTQEETSVNIELRKTAPNQADMARDEEV